METKPRPNFEAMKNEELKGWLLFYTLDGNALMDSDLNLCIEFACSVEHATRQALIDRCISYSR